MHPTYLNSNVTIKDENPSPLKPIGIFGNSTPHSPKQVKPLPMNMRSKSTTRNPNDPSPMPFPSTNLISASRLKNALREKDQRNSDLKGGQMFAKNRNYLSNNSPPPTKSGASTSAN